MLDAMKVEPKRALDGEGAETRIVSPAKARVQGWMVVDRGLISSRKPDDIPAFNRRMIEQFGTHRERRHARRGNGSSGSV